MRKRHVLLSLSLASYLYYPFLPTLEDFNAIFTRLQSLLSSSHSFSFSTSRETGQDWRHVCRLTTFKIVQCGYKQSKSQNCNELLMHVRRHVRMILLFDPSKFFEALLNTCFVYFYPILNLVFPSQQTLWPRIFVMHGLRLAMSSQCVASKIHLICILFSHRRLWLNAAGIPFRIYLAPPVHRHDVNSTASFRSFRYPNSNPLPIIGQLCSFERPRPLNAAAQ